MLVFFFFKTEELLKALWGNTAFFFVYSWYDYMHMDIHDLVELLPKSKIYDGFGTAILAIWSYCDVACRLTIKMFVINLITDGKLLDDIMPFINYYLPLAIDSILDKSSKLSIYTNFSTELNPFEKFILSLLPKDSNSQIANQELEKLQLFLKELDSCNYSNIFYKSPEELIAILKLYNKTLNPSFMDFFFNNLNYVIKVIIDIFS